MKSTVQFLKITKWVFYIYWSISKVVTVVLIVTQIYMQLQILLYAYVFGIAIDKIIALIAQKSAQPEQLLIVILPIVLVSLFTGIISTINSRSQTLLSNSDVFKLKQILYDHLVLLGLAKLEDPELTNKTTRFNEVYGQINQHLQRSVVLIASIVLLFSSAAVVGYNIPVLLPFFIFFFVIKFFINQSYMSRAFGLVKDNTESRRSAFQTAGYLIDPKDLKELLTTRGSGYLKKLFERFTTHYVQKMNSLYVGWARTEIFQSISDAILFGAGLYLIVTKGVAGGITVGALTFLIRSLGSFSDQLDGLTYRISGARESALRIKDAQEVFELYTPDTDGTVNISDQNVPPKIEFNDVTFSYPNSPAKIFDTLNLVINPGEKIAIVGENGAGKTTLVKLLSRLYRVPTGKVLIDNTNINDIKIQSFYDTLGILFQDYNMYDHLTVLENVGIGKTSSGLFNRKRAIQALKDSEAYEFVMKYPKKLDQILSERYKGGIRPSTGQWQKIAIARFFYRNAPVLILDEPTASIDAVSEAQIFDNIYKFMKGKTVIIISHRFSTVRNADRIIVLDKGKIIEDGSHEELLAKNGKYAKSFKLQAKGYS